jgi:GMP synthase-like glutamine amidotransferase
MDVWQIEKHPWLSAEKQAIRRWVRELQRPFLGICLGHQLLADALGGKCDLQRRGEIGILEIELTQEGRRDSLFSGMPAHQRVLQWHSVNVTQPPDGAKVLASSQQCNVQGMRVGPRAWSIQYHVEVEADTVENWAKVPEYRQALESAAGPGAFEKLRSDASNVLGSLQTASGLLYKTFRHEVFRARNV